MPAILDEDAEALWLARDASTAEALALLAPCEDAVATAVGPAVNDARYDGPACLEAAPEPDPTLF
jgi:putative SOS response-associated peptidase YedK